MMCAESPVFASGEYAFSSFIRNSENQTARSEPDVEHGVLIGMGFAFTASVGERDRQIKIPSG
jgi:hypothetical protein